MSRGTQSSASRRVRKHKRTKAIEVDKTIKNTARNIFSSLHCTIKHFYSKHDLAGKLKARRMALFERAIKHLESTSVGHEEGKLESSYLTLVN